MNKARFDETLLADFLAKQDLVYEKPAPIWDKGIPMGNSLLSALIWGESSLNISINRLDVWEMRRYHVDTEKFKWKFYQNLLKENRGHELEGIVQTQMNPGPTAQNLPIGRFEIITKGIERKDYKMHLSLYSAISDGHFSTEYGSLEWNCHVSALHPLILFHFKTYGNESVDIRFRSCSDIGEYKKEYTEIAKTNPARAGGKTLNGSGKLIRGYKKIPEFAQILKDWGYETSERTIVNGIHCFKQKIPDNGNYAVAWNTFELIGNEKVLMISIECDPDNGNAHVKAVENIKKFCFESVLMIERREHENWWHSFYPGSFYSISDSKLEALYWINLYKLGCQTRKEGIPPAMSGIWIPDDGMPSFLGNSYIWNTQQEVNLFAIYTGNRLALAYSTYRMLIDNRKKMKDFAQQFFEVDGEFLPHMTDYKLNCINFTPDHFELLCGPWMMQMMWKHYLYTLDKEFLKNDLYEMMKQQTKVLISVLVKGTDGKLHFPYSYSAEYPPNNYGNEKGKKYAGRFGLDATCDLAYTRFLCETLIKASEILNIEDVDKHEWIKTLKDLAPFSYDDFGGLSVRRDQPLESSHRHLTHLFPITQLYQITNDTKEGKRIIDASLHALKVFGTGEWMGWTFCEAAKIAILSNKATLAYHLLREYSDKFVNENTFDCDGSNDDCAFTIHGNMGLTVESDGMFNDALQYFAVRSYNGIIYIMDTLPEYFDDISFYNFRAEGAFLISAQRRNGIIHFISIVSEKGGTVRIKTSMDPAIQILCENKSITYSVNFGIIEFNTEVNKEYILIKEGLFFKDFRILPVESQSEKTNYYGIKKRKRI